MRKETEIRKRVQDIVDDCRSSIDVLSRLIQDEPRMYRSFIPSIIRAALPYFNNKLVCPYIRRLLLVNSQWPKYLKCLLLM